MFEKYKKSYCWKEVFNYEFSVDTEIQKEKVYFLVIIKSVVEI